MDFHCGDLFPKEPIVGTGTLIYDLMIGDSTLRTRADAVERRSMVQAVLGAWSSEPAAFPITIPAVMAVRTPCAAGGRRWSGLVALGCEVEEKL
jgi:hypothetical protein